MSPLTTSETAAALGVSQQTVGRWVRTGQLKHFRTPGGHIRIAQSTVDAILAGTHILGEQA